MQKLAAQMQSFLLSQSFLRLIQLHDPSTPILPLLLAPIKAESDFPLFPLSFFKTRRELLLSTSLNNRPRPLAAVEALLSAPSRGR